MLQTYKPFYLLSQDMVLMATKIDLRQYVIVIKPRNFDTSDIKRFTVYRFCLGLQTIVGTR